MTSIYGVQGREDAFVPYLSDDWIALLDHTTQEAEVLSMGVDLANGTGWPFGEPQMSPEHAARLDGGSDLTCCLGESVWISGGVLDPAVAGGP